MKHWITHPTRLSGEGVELLPLERSHFGTLTSLAADARIWQHYPMDASDPAVLTPLLEEALAEREQGLQYPFVIRYKPEDRIVGSTRLLYLQPRHRKLEIGWTWLHPAYWAGPVNPECKLLLLTFCFETLGTSRVQLKTDANNIRSRKAIEKIGGAFEGILRNDMLRADGSKRHSAYYGLIEEEWPGRKAALQALLQRARS